MGERYKPTKDGQWVKVKMKGDKSMCCDCGLVHWEEYKIDNGELYIKVQRDNRATGQARRWINAKAR
jgi:hypothetical protein